MLSHNIMYTALPVADLKEAMDFYEKVLGLHVVDQNKNGVWYQVGNSRIALYQSEFAGTNKGTAAIWEVANPRSIVKTLQERGVKFEKYDIKGAKRKGVIHTTGAFEAAWFKDPSGNIICISHHL